MKGNRSPTPIRRSRVEQARIYREAAARALDGFAYMYLSDQGADYSRVLFPEELNPTVHDRCLLLCFAAAMAETGDSL